MFLWLACTSSDVSVLEPDSAAPADTSPQVDTSSVDSGQPPDSAAPGDTEDTAPVAVDTGEKPDPPPCADRTGWPADHQKLADANLSGVTEGWTVNEYAPSYRKQAQDGAWYDLRQFYGDVLVVQLAAGWCPYCTADAGAYESLYQTWSEHCFTFVTVLGETGAYQNADVEYASAWASAYGLSHPVLADPEQDLAESLDSSAVPQFFVIDRSFKVRAYFSGETDPAYLEQYIQALVDDPLPY